MVVLRNCEESESDKAIEYSEELNGFYFPPSPTYFPPLPTTFPPSPSDFPLYSPPSPPRPSSSNSCVAYVWSRVRMFVQQIYDLPDLAFLVQWLDDIVDSEAKNTALEYVDENDSLNPAFRLNSEPLKKQNEDIIDQLVIDSVDVRQYLIQYRDGALDGSLLGLFSWMNESEISYGQLFTSTPEPVLQTKFSLRVWQGHRGQWVVELCYGWSWLNIGTLKTAEGAPFSSESVIRVRGGKDLFDYSFPKLFLNKNREEPTRASRTGIPPLQSPPTEQQENPNDHLGLGCSEATGNDEYEAVGNFFDRHVAVGIGSESTVECEMAEARLNNRCLGRRKTKEKNPGRERRNKGKTNGVRIAIPLEDILQTKGMQLKEAAKHLKVSPSTLRQVCRGYNINKWPPQEKYKLIGQSCPKEDDVIVKAYGSHTLKFRLYWPWEKAKLEEQVKKRLPKLEAGTYDIKYKDEDGELISIICDEDLQLYIETSRQQGTPTSIKVFLEQK